MVNDFTPWAAIHTLQENHLIALEKCLGVRTIGISEIWRRLLAKCVLKVSSAEAKDACCNAQLYTSLKPRIEVTAHAAHTLFVERDDEEEYGFLIVDAANTFNAGNCSSCLWTVRYI